jgi:DNA repair exonuclease SbcCD ATPase subunit
MASRDDVIKLVVEINELSSDAERNIASFFDDLQLFETRLERLEQTLMGCRRAKDVEAKVKCMEEFAEELKYLIERLDAMTEELNTAYNALRELIDIYHRKIKPMLGK